VNRAKLEDAGRRAARTFAQAALAYFLVHPTADMRAVTPRALLVGAAGAGLAAVWRLFLDPKEPPAQPTPVPPAVKEPPKS
jgi:hypothetical protein